MSVIIHGDRIPHEFFVTSGKGESDAGSDGLPYETGSYDAALNDAGIEDTNVIEYTSVIPTHAIEIPKEDGLKRLQWGEVLECIKAQANGPRGTKISVAVMTTSIFDPNGTYLGGFACEYSGSGTRLEAEESLCLSVIGMVARRKYGNFLREMKIYEDNVTELGYKVHPGKIFVYESLDVHQEHGTVLAVIAFVSHIFPILSKSDCRMICPVPSTSAATDTDCSFKRCESCCNSDCAGHVAAIMSFGILAAILFHYRK